MATMASMNTESTMLAFVLDQMEANKGRLKDIALATGVPYSTISKIRQGKTPNPGINVVQALADYFRYSDWLAGKAA